MPHPAVSARRQMAALLSLTALASYFNTVPGTIAPYVARDFGLSDTGIASLMGFISLGALGSFGLTRLADRHGRRRVLLACGALLPPITLATALAVDLYFYAALQVLIVAFYVTLLATTMVVITEELPDQARARGQALYGLIFTLGAAPALLLAPALLGPGRGWRVLWALPGLALLALPWQRSSLPETQRFARAVDDGSVARTRARDLFRGPYRRRAIGLLAAWTLRPIGVTATMTYLFYHGVNNLGLSAGVVTLVFIAGGSFGMAGIPLGARLSDRWGRRPTLATFSLLSVAGGIAYYWAPATFAGVPGSWLALSFAVNQLAFNAYNVAERCLDTELFPTALRATYAGSTRLGQAIAAILGNFAVSALAGPLEGIAAAITVVSVASALPAVAIFLAVAPETAGQALDESSLEREPLASSGRYS